MDDARLPETPDMKHCPVEGCREYMWRIETVDGDGKPVIGYHCQIHNPHELQVGEQAPPK